MNIEIKSAGTGVLHNPLEDESKLSPSTALSYFTWCSGPESWPFRSAAAELLFAVNETNIRLCEDVAIVLMPKDLQQIVLPGHAQRQYSVTHDKGPTECRLLVKIGDKKLMAHYFHDGIQDWFDFTIFDHLPAENKFRYNCGFQDEGMPARLEEIFVRLAFGKPLTDNPESAAPTSIQTTTLLRKPKPAPPPLFLKKVAKRIGLSPNH
jgi:hypothetical protein